MRIGVRKYLAWTAGVLMAGASAAFSIEGWLEKRADDSDMQRLQGAFAECSQKAVAPAENVSMVLEAHTNGTMKTRIQAARATFFPDSDYVLAEDIHLEQFAADSTNVMVRLDAENCLFDRKANAGWVDGNASIAWRETSAQGGGRVTAKGRGVYFSLPSRKSRDSDDSRESLESRDSIRFIKIFSQSEIHVKGEESNHEVL